MKKLLLFVLVTCNCYAAPMPVPVVAHAPPPQPTIAQITSNFDYIIACKLQYKNIEGEIYDYYCPNPPKKNVLFMSLTYESGHWPLVAIYFMKDERKTTE